MLNFNPQISLFDTYNNIDFAFENKPSFLLDLLEKHLNFHDIIPNSLLL